jgi:hypothetical protein
MLTFTRATLLGLLLLALPAAASAQTAFSDDDANGLVAASLQLGGVPDASDHWFMYGADFRLQVASGVEIVPRAVFRPLQGASVFQIDGNVLKSPALATPGHVRPFFGLGGAVRHYSPDVGDTTTKVGLNLSAGARVATSTAIEPFAMFQYTAMHDATDEFTAMAGVSLHLRR